MHFLLWDRYPIVKTKCPLKCFGDAFKSDLSNHFRRWSGLHSRQNWTICICICIWLFFKTICKFYSSQNVKIGVRAFYRLYESDMTAIMQHPLPQLSSCVSLQQADTQTVTIQTGSKSQMLNTQSHSVVRLHYISSADTTLSLWSLILKLAADE